MQQIHNYRSLKYWSLKQSASKGVVVTLMSGEAGLREVPTLVIWLRNFRILKNFAQGISTPQARARAVWIKAMERKCRYDG